MKKQIAGSAGFTLVELVVVIVITGILAALGAAFIAKPIEGYVGLARRAELVDSAESALRRMQRDIRQALPNSIRVSVAAGISYLELWHTVDGSRYRDQGGDPLDFIAADPSFDAAGPVSPAALAAGNSVVVYNLSATAVQNNAYQGDNRQLLNAGASSAASGAEHIVLGAAKLFPQPSPQQRFFIVDTPVSYVCDPAAGTLTRYSGYPIGSPTANTTSFPAGSGALVAEHVTNCGFSYAPGTSQRAALATLTLTIEEQGEKVSLLHQVHVVNAP
ncbi:MSHA biogenesis protein MshO [Desulfuromonas versatilis]|uniref:MSHA biogenesis protein MshO n=1 Tax=Desulfuromonas versatilis TaxID=2802975 RepID=A0ABN6E215_9BACT|nr:prepilin-type N-terminal cleavage/methylation domain-containing protein [Desulfuromonas versatilis]BCR06396.1 MSHA biogenesis protein MshO [Desulfuromonas versatilis]